MIVIEASMHWGFTIPLLISASMKGFPAIAREYLVVVVSGIVLENASRRPATGRNVEGGAKNSVLYLLIGSYFP